MSTPADRSVPSPASEGGDCVVVSDREGEVLRVPCGKALQRVAVAWRYLARRRGRWRGAAAAELRQQAEDDLASVTGERLAAAQLERLRGAAVLEVAMPFADEARGWEGRILPWELVLLLASPAASGRAAPVVVRRLDVAGDGGSRPLEGVGRLAVAAVAGDLAIPGGRRADLEGTFGDVTARLARERPRIVEVLGVDGHDASERLGLGTRRDGLVFPGVEGGAEHVEADRVARGLAAGAPLLVTFHVGRSAARLAALTVGHGAEAAIGFYHRVDGAAMETFFVALESRLADGAGLLAAFRAASERAGRGLDGRAVLWTRRSLLHDDPPFLAGAAAGSAKRRVTTRGELPSPELRGPDLLGGDVFARGGSAGEAAERTVVVATPVPTLNYGLLHNRRPLFVDFYLRLPRAAAPAAYEAEVSLHLGGEPIAWRELVEPSDGDEVVSLRDRVVLPLTWVLGRRLPESVRTTLAVSVRERRAEGARELFCDVFPVEILPFDEWRDDDENRAWLPSFVLPRDPAVAEIVARADGHLAALADQAHAGFDGYQCHAPGADDPWAGVDLQVRALWTVLMHDLRLRYINPPPSYRPLSQRLRSPGEVVAAGRGTCIDLALLVAACLEYVGIDPVLFLIRGHAFVGYWRQEGAPGSRLHDVATALAEEATDGDEAADEGDGRSVPWGLGAGAWSAVVDLVQRRELVPLESVELTAGGGFARATGEGLVNLRSRADFQLLLDVASARREGVTPLPLAGPEGEA